MKYALVLQGGGMKGAYYAGCMKALRERGIEPDMVCGTSTGALFGAMIAMRKYEDLDVLCAQVAATNGENIFKGDILYLSDGEVKLDSDLLIERMIGKLSLIDKAKLAFKKSRKNLIDNVKERIFKITGFMSNDPLMYLLMTHVNEEDFKADFWITLVSLKTGQLYTLKHDCFKTKRDLCLAILASSNMPVLFKTVKRIELKDGTIIEDAADGGLRLSSPIALAFQQIDVSFQWEVISINLSSLVQPLNEEEKTWTVQAGLSIDIALNEGFNRDVKMSKKINDWALQDMEWAKRNNVAYARLHNVEVPVDENGVNILGSVLDARAEWITKRIQIGYDTMSAYLKKTHTL